MNDYSISFPHLGIYLEYVPKTITIFGFDIAYYGIIIAFGILAGLWIACHMAKKSGMDPDIIMDFVIYAIVFSIIGARAYYVVFSWDMYKDNLFEILNIRNGGLAIYGAVIAAFLTLAVYAKVKKYSFWQIADMCCMGLIAGQAIGRWGNFMNREAFGDYTDSLFAMRLPISMVRSSEITQAMTAHITEGNYIQVHPTFLYESLWNLGVLILLLCYNKYKKFEGETSCLYLMGYGLGRIWIEGLRTDQLIIKSIGIPVSQLLAGTLVIISAAIIIYQRRNTKSEG